MQIQSVNGSLVFAMNMIRSGSSAIYLLGLDGGQVSEDGLLESKRVRRKNQTEKEIAAQMSRVNCTSETASLNFLT